MGHRGRAQSALQCENHALGPAERRFRYKLKIYINSLTNKIFLAHPKVLLFVTHGGLLSALEATYEGVPRVVMPFFGDQQMNAQKVFESGVGLFLNYYSANSREISDVIKTVLTDER
jgi:UDP-N-acetylglucosamine:LPS N-acetylglucosamine transferase